MKYLVLFDIDGTLLKLQKGIAAPVFFNAIQDVIGFKISSDIPVDFAGRTDYSILSYIFKQSNFPKAYLESNLNEIYNRINDYFEVKVSKEQITVLDGVYELLELLSKNGSIRLGLVTGNFQKNAILKVRLAEIDKYFSFGAFGDYAPNRLNLPKMAIQAALSNDIVSIPEKSLIIGDTHRDITSAQHNKMKSIAVATGGTQFNELLKFNPDAIYENFKDYKNVYWKILELLKII